MKKAKMLSIILAIVMSLSFSTALCANAAEAPTDSSVISASVPRAVVRRNVIVEGLRVRRSPDLNSDVIGLLFASKNDWVETDSETTISGRTWLHVVNTSNSTINNLLPNAGAWISLTV